MFLSPSAQGTGFQVKPSNTDLLLTRNAYYSAIACGVFIWFYPAQPELAFALSLGVIALQLAVMVLTQQWRRFLVRIPTRTNACVLGSHPCAVSSLIAAAGHTLTAWQLHSRSYSILRRACALILQLSLASCQS